MSTHRKLGFSQVFSRKGALRLAAGVTVGAVIAAAGVLPAQAAPNDATEAEGLMLSGGGVINLDSVAQLAGAYSAFGAGGTVDKPLQANVLDTLSVDLGNGINLFGDQGVLSLGVFGQYASSSSTRSVATSGLVGADGALGVGTGAPSENSRLDLSSVLSGLGVDGVVSELSLELGALSARAEATRGTTPTQTGSYRIAGATLDIQSPAIATLSGSVSDTLGNADDSINEITGVDGALSDLSAGLTTTISNVLRGATLNLLRAENLGVTGTVDLDLDPAIAALTARDFVSGPVTVNLGEGMIIVDLDKVSALNSLPENAVLLSDSTLNAAITTGLSDILTNQLPTAVVDEVTSVLNNTALSVDITGTLNTAVLQVGNLAINIDGSLGGFLGLDGSTTPDIDFTGTSIASVIPLGDLLNLLEPLVTGTIIPLVGGVVNTALGFDGLRDGIVTLATTAVTALEPLLEIVNQVVRITVNVTERPGNFRDAAGTDADSFTQRAVKLEILPLVPESLVTLNLASATVRGLAVPAISSITPSTGPETGGTPVVINGTGFSTATGVTFGGEAATNVEVVSSTQITAVTPVHAPGDVTVLVVTPAGSSAEFGFTYTPVTTIDGVTPDAGPEPGGYSVSITGRCFVGATGVFFGATAATSFSVVSDTKITAVVPAGTGVVDVRVVGAPACGEGTLDGGFTYVPDGEPIISAIVPGSAPQTGGDTVVITGFDFLGTTDVAFGGANAASFEVDSDTQITAVTPAHEPGAVDVVVTTPNGESEPYDFVFTPVTQVDDIDPGEGPETGGNTVVITGQCFLGATDVLFGGTSATSFVIDSDTQITAVAPAGTPGVVDITVVGTAECGDGTVDDGYEYLDLPQIDGLEPTSGPETGDTAVVITGEGFSGATGVTFGGTAVAPADFAVDSDTQITVSTPAHLPGLVDVIVLHPNGPSEPADFTYLNVPSVTNLTPASGPIAGGTAVTITGEGFTGATGVTFDGVAALDFVFVSDTSITVTTPPHTLGEVDVIVQHPIDDSEPATFTYVPNGAPVIASITPPSGPETGATPVTITGSNFIDVESVTFGGDSASFIVNSASQISTVTPAHAPGPVDVIVTTAGGVSVAYSFLYTPVTQVDEVDPGEGPETGGNTVTITGSCFLGATAVYFGEISATFTVVSNTEITATVPAGAAPGLVDVRVVGAGTCGEGTIPDGYEYLDVPDVDGIVPDSGPETGGTSVTLTGSGFLGSTGVTFGGTAAPTATFLVVDDETITVNTPAHAPGSVDVVVQHPNGASAPVGFTYLDLPSIASLTPISGPETGGTSVTITGEGFTGATGVTFGGTPVAAADFTVDSNTQITVSTPAHMPGSVDVVVQHPNGASAPGTSYEFLDVPSISTLTPASGPEAGGTTVVITGEGFTGATGVTFGGTPVAVADFIVDSNTQITVKTPAHAPGPVDVVVQHPVEDSEPGTFTYVPNDFPIVSGFSPTSGPETGGTEVVITGVNFTGTTSVTFGTVAAADFTVDSSTQITAHTPAQAPGTVPVVVTTANGTSPLGGFEFTPVTKVTGVTPGEGPQAGGNTVTITGSCFTGATNVLFGTVSATSFSVVSPTQITAVVPASAPGLVDVTVVGAGTCGTGTLVDAYELLPAPTITSVAPASGPETGGTDVVIIGTGFAGATGVVLGGIPVPAADVEVVSDTEIHVATPAHTPGEVDVVVQHPNGASQPGDFEYLAVTTIASVSPEQGPEEGGTVVTIVGHCFTGATVVTFGETAVAFTVVSDTEIRATTTAGVGLVDVTVTGSAACGSATAPDAFAFVADDAPAISGLVPDEGPETGGTTVVISGEKFTGASGVTFDGIDATSVVVDSDTQITVVTPRHMPGTVNVVVQHDLGDGAPADFTYVPATTIDEVDPPTGPEEGGTTHSISGHCFTGATGVFFGETPATSFTVVSDTLIRAVAPAGVGIVDIRVVGSATCGDATIENGFEYAAPRVTVEYRTIVRGTGVTQLVTGTGFAPGEKVDATVRSTPFALTARVADASGRVSFSFPVEADFELGRHHVDVTGALSGTVTEARNDTGFTVTAAAGSGSLPNTGFAGVWFGGGALLLLLVGATLVLRRRSTES